MKTSESIKEIAAAVAKVQGQIATKNRINPHFKLSKVDGVGYTVRRSLHDPKNIRLSKKAIRMAFEVQSRGLGFAIVELLSTCPTNWGMTPKEALHWVEDRMIPVVPLGDYKITSSVAGIRV